MWYLLTAGSAVAAIGLWLAVALWRLNAAEARLSVVRAAQSAKYFGRRSGDAPAAAAKPARHGRDFGRR